jgi:hypothetical protein
MESLEGGIASNKLGNGVPIFGAQYGGGEGLAFSSAPQGVIGEGTAAAAHPLFPSPSIKPARREQK